MYLKCNKGPYATKKNKADAEKNSLRFPVIKKKYNFGISS